MPHERPLNILSAAAAGPYFHIFCLKDPKTKQLASQFGVPDGERCAAGVRESALSGIPERLLQGHAAGKTECRSAPGQELQPAADWRCYNCPLEQKWHQEVNSTLERRQVKEKPTFSA